MIVSSNLVNFNRTKSTSNHQFTASKMTANGYKQALPNSNTGLTDTVSFKALAKYAPDGR